MRSLVAGVLLAGGSLGVSPLALAQLAPEAAPGASGEAGIGVAPKHLLILRPGVDAVFGVYVFAVQNEDASPQKFRTAALLPKETIDFVPQEGATADEVSISGEDVVVEKTFPSGTTLVSIAFKTEAQYGTARLNFKPALDINSLAVLVPIDGSLTATSDVLGAELGDSARPDPQYKTLPARAPIPTGSRFTIEVTGLPEGRSRLWLAGTIVLAALLGLGITMAVRTRPRSPSDEAATWA
jgi:hypothetical protein